MNKSEFVSCLASETRKSKKEIKEFIDSFLGLIEDVVVEGDSVCFYGFGTFGSSEKSAREGRNSQTGEKMVFKAKIVPTFSPGTRFKKAVNERREENT